MSKILHSSFLVVFFLFVTSYAQAKVIEGNGDRQWQFHSVNNTSIKRIEVSGPVYVELKRKHVFLPCNKSRIKIDQNLKKYLKFQQVDDVLKIQLDEGVVPSDWVEVRLFCLSVTHIKAESKAVVTMASTGDTDLVLDASDALINVVGKARRLNAIAKNNSVLALLDLRVEEGELLASDGSFADLLRNDLVDISAKSDAKVYVMDKTQPIGSPQEISPGVLRVYLNLYIHDMTVAFNSKKDFDHVLPLLKTSIQP